MKRLLSLVLAATLSLSLFAGCQKAPQQPTTPTAPTTPTTPQPEKPKEAKEVNFFSHVGAYKALLEQEVAKWNDTVGKDKGVFIKMESNIDSYPDALEMMIKAGNSPDIFYSSNPAYVSEGWLQPLDAIPELKGDLERFGPYLTNGINNFGGKTYYLPLEIVPIKMVYNKDLFKKNGLTEPPKTWAQVAEYAKKITENGGGKEYGYGFTYQWSVGFRRLALKPAISSTGHGWFDNNNATYNFTAFKPVIDAFTQMYKDGSFFPDPAEIAIDPIRAQFAEGLVGMEVAPAYDISVYNTQFPAKCDWGVCDAPAFTDAGAPYKGVAMNRGGFGIGSSVKADRLPEVVEAYKFLHSKELYAKLYANCAIIPHEADIINNTKLEVELKNWKEMSDITNYTMMPAFPDGLVMLEGETYHQVFEKVITGDLSFDKAAADLDKRYNEGYKKAKDAGKIDVAIYEAKVDLKK